PSTRCGRPSTAAARTTSPACTHERTYVALSVVPPSASSGTPCAAKPKVRPSCSSSATSPAALCPNRKFSPTTTSTACSRSTSAWCTNSSGAIREKSSVNGRGQNTSTPSCSTSSARRTMLVSTGGC